MTQMIRLLNLAPGIQVDLFFRGKCSSLLTVANST